MANDNNSGYLMSHKLPYLVGYVMGGAGVLLGSLVVCARYALC